jgi:hypothetical protein
MENSSQGTLKIMPRNHNEIVRYVFGFRTGLVLPPYIHNGFLASLEVADNTDVRNSVDIRNNGDVRRTGDVRNTGDARNRNKDETSKREETRNSGAARNKTVKFKMEPSVQLGKRTVESRETIERDGPC